MKKIVLTTTIIIFVITNFVTTQSQDYIDSSQYEIPRILDTYKLYQNQYETKAWNLLISFINDDEILKNKFFEGDSILYKRLKIIINPILKLSKEASDYTFKEDICKYFVFDTINFDCVAGFFLNDTLCFSISRGYNDCDIYDGPMIPGGVRWDWCTGDFVFNQLFYSVVKEKECIIPAPGLIRDSLFVFFVDGFSYYPFIIKENRISIYPGNYDSASLKLLNKPNEFIKRNYTEADIRRFVKDCPVGGKQPWWKFWD